MNDESFGQDFMWYEWGFVAPSDFPREDGDGTREAGDRVAAPTHVAVHESTDVWKDVRW